LKAAAVIAGVLVVGTALPAFALNVQILRPTTGAVQGYRLFTSENIGDREFWTGIHFNFDQEPLEVAVPGGTTPRISGIVDQFVTMDLLFSYGASPRLTLEAGLPINLFHNIAPQFIPNRDQGGGDVGDLFLNGRIQIFDTGKTASHWGMSLVPFLTLPTGRESIFFGEESVTGGGILAVDRQWKANRIYLNLGTRFRHETERIANLVVDHEFLYGLGFQRPIVKRWEINMIAEVYGTTRFKKFFHERVSMPVELSLVFEKKWSRLSHPLVLRFGGAFGLSDGYGTADFRGILGLTSSLSRSKAVERIGSAPEFISLREEIHFNTASSVILPRSYPVLDEVARKLRDHPEFLRIRIEGHTDSRADEAYNQKLSEARANAVRDYLIRRGISPDRLTAVGFGESQPIDTNETAEGRARNRRTVIRILKIASD
jgi:hypothetical protein